MKALGKVVRLPFSAEAMHKIGYYFYYDGSKAENVLGLTNRRPVRQAISESYNWYQEKGVY
jgi:nucleoside-diphosphate-sugar epimerase